MENIGNRLVVPGDVYGLWTVLDYAPAKSDGGTSCSICQCVCGEKRSVRNTSLLSGESLSCGCIQKRKKTYKKTEFQKKVLQITEQSWLGINVDDDELWNPLNIPEFLKEDPHIYLIYILSNPEYLSFVCKEVFNIDLLPFQSLLLREMWVRRFPMLIASRGAGKSFLLGVYALLRMVFMPGRKVVIAGAAFRQSKIIFEYMENVWRNAPLLRDIASNSDGPFHNQDLWRFELCSSRTIAIPIGTGDRIRGQRAHDVISDEFSSIPKDIFENVISGFASVTANPVYNVKKKNQDRICDMLEMDKISDDDGYKPNQLILSGTAYFEFNHFYDYWRRWKQIIHSRGEKGKLETIFNGDVPKDFDWKDYSVIRLPYNLIPEGFLDEKQISRSKATIHSGHFQVEYCAVFSKDSAGFFKRSLIEGCVANANNVALWKGDKEVFEPVFIGRKDREYIIGIDPASEVDNFSIVVLEIHKTHRRIVHVWTTNKQQHRKELQSQYTTEKNYFAYCAKKVRDLMKNFPCVGIALDSQGGGHQIMECFRDEDKFKDGDIAIHPIVDPDDPKSTDMEEGLHLVHLINFASAEWTSEANHGMRKDFEDKILLLPNFDSLSIGLAQEEDGLAGTQYEGMEDLISEFEDLKHELSIITMTQTVTGRDKFDVPEIKLPGGRKDRVRKDRYSALVMANAVARGIMRSPSPVNYQGVGGFAGPSKQTGGQLYMGNAIYNRYAEDAYSAYDG